MQLIPNQPLPPGLTPFRYNLNRVICRIANLATLSSPPQGDIADHLQAIESECSACSPELIVELGTRGGASTQALISSAKKFNSVVLSVDIDDCASVAKYSRWHFVKSDDVAFANQFPEWCEERRIKPEIDFLFIDTSHLYEHTKQEIAVWSGFVKQKMAFHDTNLRNIFRTKDGRFSYGWDNHRGVIRAIEDSTGIRVDEKKPFNIQAAVWNISHVPYCSGFTVMTKL